MAERQFRPDIQGLRAIAVLLVLLYHTGAAWIPGGFVGVDIFFVISGYLITGIIVRRTEAGAFRLSDFFASRIRRLYPALLCTVAIAFAVGAAMMTPIDLQRLATSSIAALGSVSNFTFMLESGYFDDASITKPLLHTWSLGVEWQFYIAWAAVLVSTAALLGRALPWIVAALALGSLGAASVAYAGEPLAFFMMPFRIFEFAIGGMLVWIAPPAAAWLRISVATIGALLVALSAFFLTEVTPFPSYWALAPAIGTAALIYARAPWLFRQVLENRPMVWIGEISYSLYLVHWPIIVFYLYAFPGEVEPAETAMLLVASLLLGSTQYYLVERPFRRGQSWRRFAAGAGLATAALVAPAASAWSQEGWSWRLPEEIRALVALGDKVSESDAITWLPGTCYMGGGGGQSSKYPDDFDADRCLAVDRGRPNVLIWGDSKAADIAHGWRAVYPEINFLQATVAACRPTLPAPSERGCDKFVVDMLDRVVPQLAPDLDAVVIAANWRGRQTYFAPMVATVEHLREIGVRILVVGDQLQLREDLPTLASQYGRTDGLDVYLAEHRRNFWASNKAFREALGPSIEFYDPYSLMCRPSCRFFADEAYHEPLTLDGTHLTADAAVMLAQRMRDSGFLANLTQNRN